ncbi:MAG: hypothetical protein F4121_04320 [Acidimicrobiia bacterium]|nr:hypothetical protein [Acidimicrobiia bacterium]MYC46158.1 hypothetical protein [Acidimicrobiia bacterium]MYI19321.1 hypothetical protein [Acidimicrobiia bacterium]
MPANRAPGPDAPHLDDLVDASLLSNAIAQGLVSTRSEGSLRILNYTPRATYDRAWNEATLTCRGLIVDETDRVVARPFPKFFGPAEPDAPPVPEGRSMVVTEKLDGSLGIAYHHPGGGIRVATRGSLTSDQAAVATEIWHEKYPAVRFGHGVTPLFEIVYPGNRIVTDYGDMRDLVLLAVIDMGTGADLPLEVIDWPGPRAARREFGSFAELVGHVSSSPETAREGFVVRFDTGPDRPHVRLKLKFPAYVVTHRMLTGLTATRVWEIVAVTDALRRGLSRRQAATRLRLAPDVVDTLFDRAPDPVRNVRADLPEEFLPWYDGCVAEFRSAADRLISRYKLLVEQARRESASGDARAFAEAALRLSSQADIPSGPMFAIANGRPDAYAPIWTQLRPHGTGDTPQWPLSQDPA